MIHHALHIDWHWVVLVLPLLFVVSVTETDASTRTNRNATVQFQCPVDVDHDISNLDDKHLELYMSGANNISNNTEFFTAFRRMDFDNWGHTYEQVKAGMYAWKQTYFTPYLNDGDSVYESACGIGLNLYMTLEILQEVKGLKSLLLYGNDYIQVSVEKANELFDHVQPRQAVKGAICQGDSTNLTFVPSDAFDLVYTGYISPVLDPLHWRKSSEENDKIYAQLCEAKPDDWKGQKLSELAQQVQDDFYGKWVSEMVRIAKPGKPVIIEQVSLPYCEEYRDWGGVSKGYWKSAIARYKWDVDPNSIQMQNENLFQNRYHVFMSKNPAPT